ncbi:hypothetical protein STA3757_06880 [Stanieria sp. NIES-3757]|nr:hypothetical protein STA3757_06880 [Stanieria sp. NIES-3757]
MWNVIWILLSPLLKILLTKFWEWILNNKTVRLQIATLYLTWLIYIITIKELPLEEENE